MTKIVLMIGVILMLWSSNATALERVAVAGGSAGPTSRSCAQVFHRETTISGTV